MADLIKFFTDPILLLIYIHLNKTHVTKTYTDIVQKKII